MVERAGREPFIPNDLRFDDSRRMLIITGPNMGGKSTYMRQTALIVILAHIGCYVPAHRAVIGPLDRIFTRIGASDDLAGGRSTFMLEMTETANILNNATAKSLVLMDEVGRGTSTFDGLSLAWACAAFIAAKIRAFTLFATHYFELTSLACEAPGVANVHVEAVEHGDTLVFLHSVKNGPANQSYGLQVAALAGIPKSVTAQARRYLTELERERDALRSLTSPQAELDLFAAAPKPVAPESAALSALRASRSQFLKSARSAGFAVQAANTGPRRTLIRGEPLVLEPACAQECGGLLRHLSREQHPGVTHPQHHAVRRTRKLRLLDQDGAVARTAERPDEAAQPKSQVTGDDAEVPRSVPPALTRRQQFRLDAHTHDFPAEGQPRQILRRTAAPQWRSQQYDPPRRQPPRRFRILIEQLHDHEAAQAMPDQVQRIRAYGGQVLCQGPRIGSGIGGH